MLVEPPGLDILKAKHPRLANAVRDGRAKLIVAIFDGRIIPIVAFAALYVAAQIITIVDRARSRKEVEMCLTIAPIGKRPVNINADCVDRRRRPQRVEMEINVA